MLTTSVPEQSPALMESLSGGHAFWIDDHLFITADDWLMGIGYPTSGEASPERFSAAIRQALHSTRATDCFAIAPELPEELKKNIIDRDQYYILPSRAAIPPRLRSPIKKAGQILRVDETHIFSAGHRKLWSEFMSRVPLPPRVRQLYALTEQALHINPALTLLNAWDTNNNLAACLVLDYSLPDGVSYIIGAHSRTHYTPHAADLLFAEMLDRAKKTGKSQIHLGLGVNPGILRFKLKWGGIPAMPYALAAWTHQESNARKAMDSFSQILLMTPSGLSKRQLFNMLPEQRPLAMLWRLEKNGRTSWIGGSAHFFCCSFEHALRKLFAKVDTVLVEGPLDDDSMNEAERLGRTPDAHEPRVADFLSEADLRGLERTVCGPTGRLAKFFNYATKNPADVRFLVAHTRPWYAFFSLWTAFLERHGWNQSVDMEVWNTALDMGKSIMGMESLAEQMASLESAPLPRIVRFLQDYRLWKKRMKNNRSAYLSGNLEAMMGTTAEFPTRTEQIIGMRDQRFRERMRPFIEQGGTAVFVGSAHMMNLRHMLAEDGFTVIRELPTFWLRTKAWLLHDTTVVLHGKYAPPSQLEEKTAEPVLTPLPEHMSPHKQKEQGLALSPQSLTAQAIIPEQLAGYVRAVSGSSWKTYGGFAAWCTPGNIVLIAFPQHGAMEEAQSADFARRVELAAAEAAAIPDTKNLTLLTPVLSSSLKNRATFFCDHWWGIELPCTTGQKLRNMLKRARREVSITRESWQTDHAALVEYYLHTRQLAPGTRHIFKRISAYLDSSADAVLWGARDRHGQLKAFCIGDFTALSTAFYMFAFRSPDSPPGTSDALLATLVDEATARGFSRVNLGLGIDSGIEFFKKKWNAHILMPHYECTIPCQA